MSPRLLGSYFVLFIIIAHKIEASQWKFTSPDYGVNFVSSSSGSSFSSGSSSSSGYSVSRNPPSSSRKYNRSGRYRGNSGGKRRGSRGNRVKRRNAASNRDEEHRMMDRMGDRVTAPSDDGRSTGSSTGSSSNGNNGISPSFLSSSSTSPSSTNTTNHNMFNQLSNLPLPGIKFRLNPLTTLKVRKIYTPLPKTVLTLGADYNTQLGVWQFRSDWEDKVIGGRLSLKGKELQLTKTWLLSVGAVEDLVTRLRLRASVDLQTGKAFARFGFRTERLNPINVVDGFTLKKRIGLDGREGHAKLEIKANFAFPEPDFEIGSESRKHLVGMGDVEIGVEEINLLMEY